MGPRKVGLVRGWEEGGWWLPKLAFEASGPGLHLARVGVGKQSRLSGHAHSARREGCVGRCPGLGGHRQLERRRKWGAGGPGRADSGAKVRRPGPTSTVNGVFLSEKVSALIGL